MNFGSPSFIRLFHRSHNYGARCQVDESDDEKELEEKAQQRERFAAAAIGFCLKHDPEFRKHFWERICKGSGDGRLTPNLKSVDMGVEPPHWADISLRYQEGDANYLWIVEIKAGARLEPRQNPTDDAFSFPQKGYGWIMEKYQQRTNTRVRYIILGADESLNPSKFRQHGFPIQQHDWENLLEKCPDTTLTNDLIKSLGELQIGPFIMEEAKKIKVNGGISQVGDAWNVLQGVCVWLNASERERRYSASQEDGWSILGVEIKRSGKARTKSDNYAKLTEVTGFIERIAFFNYASDQSNAVTKEVLIYCKGKGPQTDLLKRLSPMFDVKSDKDDLGLYIHVESSPEKTTKNDLEWFISVFEAALASRLM